MRVVVLTPEELEALVRSVVRSEIATLRAADGRAAAAAPDGPLTVEQACAMAQCSSKTLQRACRSGALQGACKPPGLDGWRIPRAALDAWMRRGKTGTNVAVLDRESQAEKIADRLQQRG